MRKMTTKALALLMCATLTFGSSNIAVYADEVTTTPTTTTEASSTPGEGESSSESSTTMYMPPTTTVESAISSTNPEGDEVTTTTIVTSGEDEKAKYEETTTVTDTKYADGSSTQTGLTQGEHTVNFEEFYQGELTVSDTIDGWKTVSTIGNTGESDYSTTGDTPENEDDQDYDYTLNVVAGREVEVKLDKNIKTEVNESVRSNELTYLNPTYPEKTDITIGDSDKFGPCEDKPAGYDYYYSGEGAAADDKYTVEFTNGNSKIKTHVNQFILRDVATGGEQVAYCCDLNTYTKNGSWYTMDNVDDATYYDTESAKHIKYITNNGYWGTESGTGSLTNFKTLLKELFKSDPFVCDADVETFIDVQLNAGMAEVITQSAIWMYANHDNKNWKLTGIECWKDSGTSDILYELTKLFANQSVSDDEVKDTDILNKENALKSLGFTIKDKATGYTENEDDNNKNDVYNVDISFALGVTLTDNDDLIVKIINTDGEVVKSVRLAGDNSSTGYTVITPDSNGVYTIDGLELAEGSRHTFTMKLEGAQYLQNGVYLYTANGGHNASQTFIGIAEGKRSVDLSTKVSFEFKAVEALKMSTRKWSNTWEEKSEPEIIPPEENPEEPVTPPTEEPTPEVPENPTPEEPKEDVPVEVPVEDIVPEEPTTETPVEETTEKVTETVVKEAKVTSNTPKTGDASMADVCLMAMLACVCIGAALISRRFDLEREAEEEMKSDGRSNSRGHMK